MPPCFENRQASLKWINELLPCKQNFCSRLEMFNQQNKCHKIIERWKIGSCYEKVRSMIMCLCLFFGSNGVSGGSYHYRVLVHIPILDHRFLRDYLTRNEPKLHVFNLLNWEKKVQRKTDLRIVKMGLVQNGKYFR